MFNMAIICRFTLQSYNKNVEKLVFLWENALFFTFFLKKFGVFEKKVVSLQADKYMRV